MLAIPSYCPLLIPQIANAFARLFPVPQNSSVLDDIPESLYKIRVRSDGVTVCDADAQEVAEVDRQHADVIKEIKVQVRDLSGEVKLFLDGEAGAETRKARSRPVLGCAIDLYGPARVADLVGTYLGEAKIFLQEPRSLSSSIPYFNPHVYSTTTDHRTPFFTEQQSKKDQYFDEEIYSILCQTFDYDSNSSFEQDSRVKTILRP